MPLRNRDFSLLWVGQLVSQLGNQLNYVALAWLVLRVTGSAAAMSGVLLAQVLPNALFGWGAGVLVDRIDRRRLMVACDWARAALVLYLPLACGLARLPLAAIYFVTFAVSTLTLLFWAAEKSVTPALVDEEMLTAANAYSEMTGQVAALFGPVAAGFLVAVLPSPLYALYLDAASFAFSAALLLQMHWREVRSDHDQRPDLGREIWEGVRFLATHRSLRVVAATAAAVNFLLAPFAVIFPVLSERVLHTGAAGFGWLMGGFGGGMLVGSVLAHAVSERFGRVGVVYGGMVVVGAAFAGLGQASSLPLAVLLAAVAGAAVAPGNACILTWVQEETEERLRGRVFSCLFAAVGIATPLGVVMAAPLLDSVGAPVLLQWIGALTVLFALVGRYRLRTASTTSAKP